MGFFTKKPTKEKVLKTASDYLAEIRLTAKDYPGREMVESRLNQVIRNLEGNKGADERNGIYQNFLAQTIDMEIDATWKEKMSKLLKDWTELEKGESAK